MKAPQDSNLMFTSRETSPGTMHRDFSAVSAKRRNRNAFDKASLSVGCEKSVPTPISHAKIELIVVTDTKLTDSHKPDNVSTNLWCNFGNTAYKPQINQRIIVTLSDWLNEISANDWKLTRIKEL